MAPPAAKNFKQTQPITTGLRVICESYPANTCLRELLQNGDDAGATEIEYVLDTASYSSGPFLYDALQAYHGPALLVRNNSVFTDEDFKSLSSVGDSRKRHDAGATGKFGLGFNSVYHWTDGPWIYSRNWLLMLDPHESWSGETGQPGGPAWDVVENHECIEIQNHLKTFSLFNLNLSHEIKETIIRVPLRTLSQAKTSKIAPRMISVDEIKEALGQFGQDMKDGGLLFLKHIRRIVLRIDNEILARIEISETDSDSMRIRNEIPGDFKKLYSQQVSSSLQQDISKSFEIQTKYSAGAISDTTHYLIQHTMLRSSGNQELDKWARDRKLFPWTAIAAPLNNGLPKGSFQGRLFCTLRMPILTKQPIHIHGLWSITPDRSRLSSSGQSEGYEDQATRWNQFMFQQCASSSWASLLLYRSQVSWKLEKFELWPHITSSPVDLWSRLDDWVIDKIIHQKLQVWNTSSSCVDAETAYMFEATPENIRYASALAYVTLPTVYLSKRLLDKVQQRAKLLSQPLEIASPAVVRRFLQINKSAIKPGTSSLVLNYCLLDLMDGSILESNKIGLYSSFKGIPIWPTLNGDLVEFGGLLLPRSRDEMDLFSEARGQKTVDIDRLEPAVFHLLVKDINYFCTFMRFRVLDDLQIDWPILYPPAGVLHASKFSTGRPPDGDKLLEKVWRWICSTRHQDDKVLLSLQRLWLIPLNNFRLRQYLPGENSPLTLIAEKLRPSYQDIVGRSSREDANAPAILDSSILPAEAIELLRTQARSIPKFRGACQTDFSSLVSWLAATVERLRTISDQQKNIILEDLASLARMTVFKVGRRSVDRDNLKLLPLYTRIVSASPYDKQITVMSDLVPCEHVLRIPTGLPPIPDVPGVAFFDFSNANEKYLVDLFSLVEDVPFETLMKDHLLPFARNSSGKAKDSLINFIFAHPRSRSPSSSWITLIKNCPIVPISVSSSDGSKQYRCLSDLIRPNSKISNLFFREEEVFPENGFYQDHSLALIECGIKGEPTWQDLVGRIQYFSQHVIDLNGISDKVECLFACSIPSVGNLQPSTIELIQNLKWLPGKPASEIHFALLSPKMCRGPELSLLTDFVLGSTRFSPGGHWRTVLGWNERIGKDVLFRQLDICLTNELHDKVDQILTYLDPNDYLDLLPKPCILSSRKKYRHPQTTFLPNSLLNTYPMAPFLDEVDTLFTRKHKKLISAFNIRKEPVLEDLLDVLRCMRKSSESLDEHNLRVAISSLEIATQLYAANELTEILVPDSQNVLRELTDIVHGICTISDNAEKFNFTHSAISSEVIGRLGIENSLARAMRLNLEIEDEDEDEYTPGEKLTNIIADTLGRYPVESTFNEYLANADDCGSSKISWILDKCKDGPHSSARLLAPELKALQGPALFTYNDGVFSNEDFAGFKDIGCGSKAHDVTSTGMFGRGALSMYHFTDVPMIVSGKSFLILDPQRRLLPKNKHFQRKAGIKISLATANRDCPDQLTPFDGLCGFSKGLEEYKGTLFRFGFRKSVETQLKDNSAMIGSVETERLLREYFKDADMAMLFLRNVSSMSFVVRGHSDPLWNVSATRSKGSQDEIFQKIQVDSHRAGQEADSKTWRIGMMDVDKCPKDLVKPGRGAHKITECGIAACLTHPDTSQRVFCALPTDVSSLPVSFHASFAITGDRKTIAFESERHDKWNRWLLCSCIPGFYLQFLKDLAPQLGEDLFRYWPATRPSKSPATMSDIVAKRFWEILGECDTWHLFPLASSLSPSSTSGSASLLTARPSSERRKLYPCTSLKAAQFDFLPPRYLELQPLFLDLCPNLVRLPERFWDDTRACIAFDSAEKLGPEMFCNLFQQEANCCHLSNYLSSLNEDMKVVVMEKLLQVVVPPLEGNPKSLDVLSGCRILPRLDGSLGLLVSDNQFNTQWNLVVNHKEQELFGFAASRFVDTRLFKRTTIFENPLLSEPGMSSEAQRNPITDIVKSSLNVRRFEPKDIGALLALPQSPTQLGETEIRDKWTKEFWRYLNKLPHTQDDVIPEHPDSKITNNMVLKCGLQHQRIYRAKTGSGCQYLSPTEFEAEACVIEPKTQTFNELCLEIPHLKIVDRKCVPYTYLQGSGNSENDLNNVKSLARLIRAFQTIERQKRTTINVYLSDKLTNGSRTVLRDLALDYVKREKSDEGAMDVLRALPVWPCLSEESSPNLFRYTSAKSGYFCKHAAMLMSWVKDRGKFVNPAVISPVRDSILAEFGIHLMTPNEVWAHIQGDLPSTLDEWGQDNYRKFIRYIAPYGLQLLDIKIIPNGDGVFCLPSSLFDHKDRLFLAAFRKQKNKRFLHPSVQDELYHFGVNMGLRTRFKSVGTSQEDYLQCVLAIQARDSEPDRSFFDEDAEIVTSYLLWDNSTLRFWSSSTWRKLSKVQIFHVADDLYKNPMYRQPRMLELAEKKSHCSLEELGRLKDQRIIWSQKPFSKAEPVPFVFENSPDKGYIPAETVLKHLVYLVEIRRDVDTSEIPEYLKDVQACYAYLQEKCEETKLINGIWEAEIWLNVDTLEMETISSDQLDSSLTSASLLCMNCPTDPLPSKVTRKFLAPYEKLLRHLGCPSVTQPPRIKTSSANPELPIDATMVEIRNLRDQGEFVDIIFEAEGIQKPAHKIFMVAISRYCRAQFLGEWGHQLSQQSVIHLEDMRFKALSEMVDFAYTGTADWPPLVDQTDTDKIASRLDDLLDLLQATDRWFVDRLHQIAEDYIIEHSALYIRADNVLDIKEIAESTRAENLKAHCEAFIAANYHFVSALSQLKRE